MKKATKFVIVGVFAVVCVISAAVLTGYQSPKKYIELLGESGLTVVKTSSILDLDSENVIVTYSVNQFVDSMTRMAVKLRQPGGGTDDTGVIRWGSNMRDTIIYWYRDSQHGLVFYFIDIQGRSIVFRPG